MTYYWQTWVKFSHPFKFPSLSNWGKPTKYRDTVPRVPQYLFLRPNWDLPALPPSPPIEFVSPPGTKGGGDTLACGWGGLGGPNSDDWRKILALRLLCGWADIKFCCGRLYHTLTFSVRFYYDLRPNPKRKYFDAEKYLFSWKADFSSE